MNCKKCAERAVMHSLCKKHFLEYFEAKVYDAIEKHKMIVPGDKVCVGVSGGKDSISMLHILKKYEVVALAVDEGIKGYRSHTLEWLKEYCAREKIKLNVLSFKKEYGKTLDELHKKNACTECGVRRRELLNKGAKGFDKLAIGHNLDDTAQTILMNLFKGNVEMMPRALPLSEKSDKFVQRIKPLYYCGEKEVLLYAVLNGLNHTFVECPYMHDSFRDDVRTALNKYPGSVKRNIVEKYLGLF